MELNGRLAWMKLWPVFLFMLMLVAHAVRLDLIQTSHAEDLAKLESSYDIIQQVYIELPYIKEKIQVIEIDVRGMRQQQTAIMIMVQKIDAKLE